MTGGGTQVAFGFAGSSTSQGGAGSSTSQGGVGNFYSAYPPTGGWLFSLTLKFTIYII